MMKLKVIGEEFYKDLLHYNDNDNIVVEYIDENSLKGKKIAHKLKYHYGARVSPFAEFTDNDFVKVFYSEDDSCTIHNVITFLKNYGN